MGRAKATDIITMRGSTVSGVTLRVVALVKTHVGCSHSVMRTVSLAATLLIIVAPARAASIEVYRDQQPTVISIDGTLGPKDFDGFLAKAYGLKEAVVRLKSIGGSILPAMAIGREVRQRGYATEVREFCSSACSLVWMAGSRRYLPPGSRVGFHQPIDRNRAVSINGVALEASYLARLGLSDTVVSYAISAPPSELRWLTVEDAQRIGLALMPSSAPVVAMSPLKPDGPTAQQH
jgi:hypothetical protein